MDVNSKKTVFVVGGTGNQGESVVNALLKNPEKWNIRVLTRNPQSDKAISLQKRGCQIVQGDLSKKDELVKLLKGVDMAFLVTTLFEPPFSKEKEIEQGKNFADAAVEIYKESKQLEAIVFSALPHAEQLTNGEIKVAHFDSKTEIEKYMIDLKLPVISVGIGYYMENFQTNFCSIEKFEENHYFLKFSMKPEESLCLVHIEQYGVVVSSVLENYKNYFGKTIYVVSEVKTIQNIAEILREATGYKIDIVDDIPISFTHLPFAVELRNMFRFNALYHELCGKDVDFVKSIIGEQGTFKEFVEKSWKDWPIFKPVL